MKKIYVKNYQFKILFVLLKTGNFLLISNLNYKNCMLLMF